MVRCVCVHIYKNAAPTLAFSGYWLQYDARANIFTKMLIHIRIFGMFNAKIPKVHYVRRLASIFIRFT